MEFAMSPKRMQPGVTVVLATVWLTVYGNVVGTATLQPSRLTLDQYSPLAPRRHGVYRKVEGQLDWKDQNPAENQPLDLSIGPRRSISANTEFPEHSLVAKYVGKNSIFPRKGNHATDDFSPLFEGKQYRNFGGREFTDEKVDGRNLKTPELLSRELPPSELEDPFVADDTFQDQGPGSVEIYKLDLLGEKPLLNPTPVTRLLAKSKSKAPKKSSHASWKAKTTDYGATSPKMFYKQSNSFDNFGTELPPNGDPFSVGGVPELQVGCEGLEATNHKQKRSIDSPTKDKESGVDLWPDATPISLNVDYDLSSEEGYEEMDELVKLKKLDTTTKGIKHNRGDMEATLHSDFLDDKGRAEILPVRGDLGQSSVVKDSITSPPSSVLGNKKAERRLDLAKESNKGLHFGKAKRSILNDAGIKSVDGLTTNRGRKILWFDDSAAGEQSKDEKRSKRGVWGFGEDEGVVSSDELQTENERRRKDYERRRQEIERRRQEEERRREEEVRRRGYIENRTNTDIQRIRDDYEKLLRQNQKGEEERQRQLQQESQRWQTEEETRRRMREEEARRRMREEETRRNRWQDEERRRQEEERTRQRQLEEELRTRGEGTREQENRLREQERRRRPQEEEMRRNEESRRDEENKRRRQQELDRRHLEERRREWAMKKNREEEEERRRQQQNRNEPPSSLVYPMPFVNATRPYQPEAERRMREQQARERDQKLREYIQRNQPINVTSAVDRRREEANRRRIEEERRKQEEERKLQEYVRRNQPIHVPKTNESYHRNWLEERRTINEAGLNDRSRYPGPGSGRRNHGPSAPTNVYPQSYANQVGRTDTVRSLEEQRIRERERQQEEQLRREALRREEEVRRIQMRRYEEDRKRQEAAQLEAERRRKEFMEQEAARSQAARIRPLENRRPVYEDRRRFEEHRRRQDTSLIPANLASNESRRAMELQRQRQQQERRRIEIERRRQEASRAKGTREDEERARAMKEQRRRQEEARLNALPVSARIIVRPGASSSSSRVLSRGGFDNDIDFPGINPNRHGAKAPNFPAPPNPWTPVKSPPPCVWAVVQCCPTNSNRLVTCFESMGCPGINWDPNPCRGSITQAATDQVMKFYAAIEENERV
ncbi:golgin subfamily A member 6-like protein 22 isoform X1 [Hylaeus volcanicus]|uniref:golgin subfamily A member 6-like protein 22 isoform X1 n=2 Tax=Hylaeus volcanicus TaxID=313075 RepID=UPI0023B7AF9D|nr:golgin subfamily A member 6-like protein 22 isoform X1 [Hylaeus volcanicus]